MTSPQIPLSPIPPSLQTPSSKPFSSLTDASPPPTMPPILIPPESHHAPSKLHHSPIVAPPPTHPQSHSPRVSQCSPQTLPSPLRTCDSAPSPQPSYPTCSC